MLKKLSVVIALSALLSACSDQDGAQRILEGQGYTEIQMLGSPWFAGCSKEDLYVDEFRATNFAGKPSHGVVCSGWGWGKATTIHLYAQ